jgi:hypothetical protein
LNISGYKRADPARVTPSRLGSVYVLQSTVYSDRLRIEVLTLFHHSRINVLIFREFLLKDRLSFCLVFPLLLIYPQSSRKLCKQAYKGQSNCPKLNPLLTCPIGAFDKQDALIASIR